MLSNASFLYLEKVFFQTGNYPKTIFGWISYIALLLQGIGQVTVGVREVGLQFNGAPVGVNGQIDKALLIVDAGQVSVDHSMVGAQTQGPQVAGDRSENGQIQAMMNRSCSYSSKDEIMSEELLTVGIKMNPKKKKRKRIMAK